MPKKLNVWDKYKLFLRVYVSEKYFAGLENLEILADGFIDNYYIVIAELKKEQRVKRFFLIENITKPLLIELLIKSNRDDYITICKRQYGELVPQKLRHKLAKQGICSNYDNGMKKTNRACFHRFVGSLFYNCIGLEVHHIDKNKLNNHISNLVPLRPSLHKLIDKDEINGKNLALEEQFQLLANRNKRNQTVANNEKLLEEIIELKNKNKTVKEVSIIMKSYIKKSKIYEIYNFFHYSKDFVKWLQIQQEKVFLDFYGNYQSCWNRLLEFERLII